MNDIAKMISDETKTIVEESGKKYVEPDFDDEQPNNPTPEEQKEFNDQVLAQIEEGAEEKRKEQAEYRRMFGADPRGNAPTSYSI
jgi:hypothetical protein